MEGGGLVADFHKFIGILDHEKYVLISGNVKTWVTTMNDAQRLHFRRIHVKTNKYWKNSLVLNHHFCDTNVTYINGLGFYIHKVPRLHIVDDV